jgi:hypothetical protein
MEAAKATSSQVSSRQVKALTVEDGGGEGSFDGTDLEDIGKVLRLTGTARGDDRNADG